MITEKIGAALDDIAKVFDDLDEVAVCHCEADRVAGIVAQYQRAVGWFACKHRRWVGVGSLEAGFVDVSNQFQSAIRYDFKQELLGSFDVRSGLPFTQSIGSCRLSGGDVCVG